MYNLYSVSLTASHDIAILQNTYTNHTIIYSPSTSNIQLASHPSFSLRREQMQILSIMPPRFLHSKEYHDYPNATMNVIDASAFPMPAGAQIGRSSKFHHIRHQKSACFTRSSQSKKTAVSIYTTKGKGDMTENQHDFRHRHSDSLYRVHSDCFSST